MNKFLNKFVFKNAVKFDKVFVISYINNFEKRKIISKKLHDLGIKFEFIYGSNLYDIPQFRTVKQLCTEEQGSDYNMHNISGSLAHLNAIEYAYNAGHNNVLIIEDDVLLYNNKDYILNCLNNYPKDADLIQYGWINFSCFKSDKPFTLTTYTANDGWTLDHYSPGAQMYALCNRETMKDYIESQHQHYSSADNIYIFKYDYENKYKKYRVFPQLAIDYEHEREIVDEFHYVDNFITEINNYS
jgi:GR25 family glycosyltransferase involved in LPS biosynthesis